MPTPPFPESRGIYAKPYVRTRHCVCLPGGEALEAFQRKYGRLLQREYDSVVAVYGDCRGRFEKCYDENIKGFMRTMLDTDTVLARKKSRIRPETGL